VEQKTAGSGRGAQIRRFSADGLDAVSVARRNFEKFYITVRPRDSRDIGSMFERLGRFCRDRRLTIVLQDVFGCCDLYTQGRKVIENTCGGIEWPVTWIQGEGRPGTVSGTQIYAVSGLGVERIEHEGRIVGGFFEDSVARYCFLGDLRAAGGSGNRPQQAMRTFELAEWSLSRADMDFSHVIRTWMYIADILSWYGEFNAARDGFFKSRGILAGPLPASTGVGVGNPAEAAVVADAMAIRPKGDAVKINQVDSPMQCPAPDYRSSFSRAVEVEFADHRRLYVSGTASIAADGRTAHTGDIRKQIDLTMEIVRKILRSRRMNYADVTRAVAYFKDIGQAHLMDEYIRDEGLPPLPLVTAHSDICRDELLFEIEVDAVVA
jgi:enamine deaminase RidA (YjgF/YER057c/UK114 family)